MNIPPSQTRPFPQDTEIEIKTETDSASLIVSKGQTLTTTATVIDAPPASEWHPNAIKPGDVGYETVDINGNLRSWLESHRYKAGDPFFLLILNDTIELNQLCREDPALLGSWTFTLKPDEFWEHELTVNLGGQTVGAGPTFQGFKGKPSGNGYHARHTGKGVYEYRLCKIRGGYKGIASTGRESDTEIFVRYCDISGMTGEKCAGIYQSRGRLITTECAIYEIGHERGQPRPDRSIAQLNHLIYHKRESVGNHRNLYGDTSDSHAVQLRGGGTIDGLLANRTANGVLFGHEDEGQPIVEGTLQRAIIVNTEDIDPERQRTGVCVNTRRARLNVSNSILADERSAGMGSAFKLSHDTDLNLSGVRVQGVNRLYDIDGHNVNISGDVGWSNFRDVDTIDANARKFQNADGSYSRYDTGGVQATVTKPDPATLPDFDSMERPEPGQVGTLINSILTGATQ